MGSMISVIVPVYNVEGYLRECVDSLLRQTYSDLEIILIDDGSTDQSGAICEEYQKKDSRVVVIHQENAGLSAARNVGMEYAKGEYIGFVDSDDLVHPQMYEFLMTAIQQENADVAICKEFAFFDNAELAQEKCYPMKSRNLDTVNREEYCRKFLQDFLGPITWAWNKLYKKNCLREVKFPVGKLMEDIWFSSDIVRNVTKVVFIPERMYYYRQRQGSIMNSGNSRIIIEHSEALVHSYYTLKDMGDNTFGKEYWKNTANRLAGLEAKAYQSKFETERKEVRKLAKQLYEEKLGILGLKIGLVRYFPYVYYLLK